MQEFVHLHVHTDSSILDGMNRINDLLKKAGEYRMPAVAITDHANMFGVVEFYEAARKAGIKPIIGCEVYVDPGGRFERGEGGAGHESPHHLVLLAENPRGYKNLMKLATHCYLDDYHHEPWLEKGFLEQHSKGLIALSGCLKGAVPSLLGHGENDRAYWAASELKSIFPDSFYFEMQENGIPGQAAVNREMLGLSKELGIPLVATNNCHYLERKDARAHEVLRCIEAGTTMKDKGRPSYATDQLYFKSPREMVKAFQYCPEAIRNTIAIAERCNLEIEFGKYHLPQFPVLEGYDTDSFFVEAARSGLEDRFARIGLPEEAKDGYRRRLADEIAAIRRLNCQGYFLVVADYINHAKSRNIPVGPGRGSAPGSIVAYALGITDIDPVRYGLPFDRFLNPATQGMPDIDVDFCEQRREEVIDYVTGKYGWVARITTFGAMKARAVIRDVGRALDIPGSTCDRVANMAPDTPGATLSEVIEADPRFAEMESADPRVGELLRIAGSLEGLPRHASTHAAGVVIVPEPLTEFVSLWFKPNEGEWATQYDMKALEKIGLIKFDFLGLSALTITDRAVKMVNRGRGGSRTAPTLDMALIPMDDKATFDLLSHGRTDGIWGLESAEMKEVLLKVKPSCFEDLIALVAIYRPGLIGSGMVDDFINREKEFADADGTDGTRAEKLFAALEHAGYSPNKSHSAAYALIAYRMAWLKAIHPEEFMTCLMT